MFASPRRPGTRSRNAPNNRAASNITPLAKRLAGGWTGMNPQRLNGISVMLHSLDDKHESVGTEVSKIFAVDMIPNRPSS
jgi:hypothetical protein